MKALVTKTKKDQKDNFKKASIDNFDEIKK